MKAESRKSYRLWILLWAAIILPACVPHLAAFEIKLFPASQVYDQDTEILHERLGVKGQPLKVEDFENEKLENWLRTNLKAGGEGTEQAAWAGNLASASSDLGEFEIRLPKIRFFGVGLADNDGGNERVSVNGNPPVQLKRLPGHAGNGIGRAVYVLIAAEPGDPDIRSVVFDQCFTVNFDHLIVLQDKIPQKQEKLLPRLVLSLVDGTRLVAYAGKDFIQISVRGKDLDLPFDRISSVQFPTGTNVATVLLKNGEKMSCELRFSELKLTTILGDVSLPKEKIRHLKVTPRGEFQPARDARSAKLKVQFHSDEPSYDGRPLRWWLSKRSPQPSYGKMQDFLAPDADAESAEQQSAKQAIQRIGPAAVPFLLELLRLGDRDAVRGFAALGDLAKGAVPDLLFLLDEPDNSIHYSTIWSIGHIGPAAKGAIPVLLEELRLSPQSHVAAEALGNIGPVAEEAVPLIVKKLSAGDHPYDLPLIIALGKIGSKDAIPILVEIAQGIDSRRKPEERGFVSEMRKHRAVEALGNIGPAAGPAVPVLVRLLKQAGSGYFSERIIPALGSIGPNAREAVPLLREIAERQKQSSGLQPKIAQSAAAALAKIQTDTKK